MSTRKDDEGLGGYSDDEGDQLSVRTSTRRILPYDVGSRVVPGVDVGDLSVSELQALLYQITNEPAIGKIQSKSELLSLLQKIKVRSQVQGMTPTFSSANIPRADIICDFNKKNRIGRGGFGTVYRGVVHELSVAIKVLNNPRLIHKLRPSLRKEVEIMRANHHPHICLLLGVCEDGGQMFIVMEKMKGDLEAYLAERKDLSLLRRLDIARQVGLALSWLHSIQPTVYHLDLKLENVLYDEHHVMKLTDFGLSVILDDEAEAVHSEFKAPGNVGHMPPEIIGSKPFTSAADVYGFGILLWEILKGYEWENEVVAQLERMRISTKGGNLRHIVKRAICYNNLRPELPQNWDKDLCRLLELCWAANPDERPTMNEVVRSLVFISAKIARNQIDFFLPMDQIPRANAFWKRYFSKKLEDQVPWEEFSRNFYSFFNLKYPSSKDEESLRPFLVLRLVLDAMGSPQIVAVDSQSDVPSSAADASAQVAPMSPAASNAFAKGGSVTFERFAKICDAFGPLEPIGEFFNRIEQHLGYRWFHPQLSQAGAQQYLKGQQDGTFVVRFSNKPRCPFTLTRVSKDRLYQTRIYKMEDGRYRIGESNSAWAERRYHSLANIMKAPEVIQAFNLKNYVQFRVLSPGDKLLLSAHLDTNYAPDMCETTVVDEMMGNKSPSPDMDYVESRFKSLINSESESSEGSGTPSAASKAE